MVAIWNVVYRTLASSEYLLLLGAVFMVTALATGTFAVLLLRRDWLRGRLARLIPTPSTKETVAAPKLMQEESSGFVMRVTKPLHKIAAPSDATEQKQLRLLLTQAGLRSPGAYRNYLALRVLLGLLLPAGYLFILLFYKLTLQIVATSVLLGAIGFFLPTWAVRYLVYRRKRRINRALPDALDLMVVCAEAGLGLDMTLKRVGEEIRPMAKDLSDELFLTNLEVKAGKPRNESFKNMTLRTGVQEVGNLMAILVQASRFGTNIAQALRVHAEAMRVRRRQAAEEQAGKLMVKLMFPLVLFIFPAIFVVVVGPAAIRVAKTLFPAMGGG